MSYRVGFYPLWRERDESVERAAHEHGANVLCYAIAIAAGLCMRDQKSFFRNGGAVSSGPIKAATCWPAPSHAAAS